MQEDRRGERKRAKKRGKMGGGRKKGEEFGREKAEIGREMERGRWGEYSGKKGGDCWWGWEQIDLNSCVGRYFCRRKCLE